MKKAKTSKKKVLDLVASVSASVSNCMRLAKETGILEPYDNTKFEESLRSKNGNHFKGALVPQYLSLPPPLMECEDDELIWFDLTSSRNVQITYDTSNFRFKADILELVQCGLERTLSSQEEHLLLVALKEERDSVMKFYGLIPDKFALLVENNPTIAVQFVVRQIKSSKYDVLEHLYVLANMAATLNSMNVVYQLAMSFSVPTEIIHLYTSNCIEACELVSDKDLQPRLVRLVCGFLQSMIKRNLINIREMHIEILNFCSEHYAIKEAVVLYRLIKNMKEIRLFSNGPNINDFYSFKNSKNEKAATSNNKSNEISNNAKNEESSSSSSKSM